MSAFHGRARARAAVWSLGLSLAAACARARPVGEGGGAGLLRGLELARRVQIHVRPGPAEAACWVAAARIAGERGVDCTVLSTAQRGDPGAVRIVVAGPEDELGLELAGRVGLDLDPRNDLPCFAWKGHAFPGARGVLFAVYEDPDRPGLPLTLLFGNDEAVLGPFVESLEPGWRPWLRVYYGYELALEAPLSTTGSVDAGRMTTPGEDLVASVAAMERLPRVVERVSAKAAEGIDAADQEDYLAAVARARSATLAWTGDARPRRLQLLRLQARPEDLPASGQGASLSTWNPVSGEVHALVAPGIPHDGGLAAARALGSELLGPTSATWIADGAAVHAADRWWGRDLDAWIAWLAAGGLGLPVTALLDPRSEEANSPHLLLPMRAALFRYLLDSRGEGFLRDLWTGRTELVADGELERGLESWIEGVVAQELASTEARRGARRGALLGDAFLAGVGIEEPGPAPARGFGSAAYLRSLDEARAIGARAVSLTSFLAAERLPPPVPALRRRAEGRPAEGTYCGDLRLFCGLRQAKAAGLRTLMQPHLVTAPGGSIAGTGPQEGENGWLRFFDRYRRFVVHVALLAELADADGLSLGGGMAASTTRSRGGSGEGPEGITARRAGWERVTAAARGAFSGTLTWTSDSPLDAGQLAFWDRLDAVACGMDAQLDDRWTSGREAARAAARQVFDSQLRALGAVAREHGKPLLLLEAGFRSGAPAPGGPRTGRITGSAGFQAMQIEVLGEVLAEARDEGRLDGALLWRWSSDPNDAGVNARDALLRPGPAREAAARALAGL